MCIILINVSAQTKPYMKFIFLIQNSSINSLSGFKTFIVGINKSKKDFKPAEVRFLKNSMCILRYMKMKDVNYSTT